MHVVTYEFSCKILSLIKVNALHMKKLWVLGYL